MAISGSRRSTDFGAHWTATAMLLRGILPVRTPTPAQRYRGGRNQTISAPRVEDPTPIACVRITSLHGPASPAP